MTAEKKLNIVRWLLLAFVLAIVASAYLFGIEKEVTFELFKTHRSQIQAFVAANPLISPFIYITAYAIAVAISLPIAAALSIIGGFLFPQPLAIFYTLIAATSGATLFFCLARRLLGQSGKSKIPSEVKEMRDGFLEDAASYLLFLRLAPLFPFWIVNLAAALFSVPLKTFVWTTSVGIIPGTFAFTQAGAGLASILSFETIMTLEVKVALAALAIVALLPALLKKIYKKRGE